MISFCTHIMLCCIFYALGSIYSLTKINCYIICSRWLLWGTYIVSNKVIFWKTKFQLYYLNNKFSQLTIVLIWQYCSISKKYFLTFIYVQNTLILPPPRKKILIWGGGGKLSRIFIIEVSIITLIFLKFNCKKLNVNKYKNILSYVCQLLNPHVQTLNICRHTGFIITQNYNLCSWIHIINEYLHQLWPFSYSTDVNLKWCNMFLHSIYLKPGTGLKLLSW